MKKYNRFVLEKNISVNIPLPEDIRRIARLFHNAGKDLFVVGGSIRDFLQGKTPHDYDIVTNALPYESKKILKGWDVSDEQGKNFGVLRIFTEDEPLGYELAVFRSDISKGRDIKGDDKKVEIGKHITIEDDVKRRDFSINSLFYDINKKEIVDLVGGVDDIKNGIIRAVGIPSERFNEDRLRILRCFRFSARTNGKIDTLTSEAIRNDHRLRGIGPKDDVSQQRIIEEIDKVFEHAEKDPSILQRYIDLLTEYDMWEQMFPGLNINTNVIVDIVSKPIVFFDLLKNENLRLISKVLNKLTFPTDLVNKIIFLQDYISKSTVENVYKLALLKDRFHIDDDLILDFVNKLKLDLNFAKSFIKYCKDGFVISGDDLKNQGFQLADIGKEKERLEIERFKSDYM